MLYIRNFSPPTRRNKPVYTLARLVKTLFMLLSECADTRQINKAGSDEKKNW